MTATQKTNGGHLALAALAFLRPFIEFSTEQAENNVALTDAVPAFGTKMDDAFEAKSNQEIQEIGAGLLAISDLAALMSTMVGLRYIARTTLGVKRLGDITEPVDPRLS